MSEQLVAAKYKQTDIGTIPSDWKVKTLGECLIGTPQYGIGAAAVEYSDILPTYLRITDISEDGKFKPENKASVNHPLSSNYYLEEGDLVFARTGASVGKSYLYNSKDGKLVFAGFLIRVKPNQEKLLSQFLKGFVETKHYWSWVNVMSMRSGQPGINGNEYAKLPIPLPPTKAEQTAIATALSDAVNYISSLEKLIAKKRLIKQGAMQELLTPKENWVEKTLREVATYRRGSFPQPYGLDKWYDDIAGKPFVQVYDVDDNMTLKNETKWRISKEAQAMSVFAKKGTVVLTIQGSIGRIAITQYDAYIDRTLLIFESFLIPFDPYFFMLIVHILFEYEKQNAPGGIIKTITKEALSSFKISFPKIEEQIQIATIVKDIEMEITGLEKQLAKAQIIKQGMMQQLLTGKIRLV